MAPLTIARSAEPAESWQWLSDRRTPSTAPSRTGLHRCPERHLLRADHRWGRDPAHRLLAGPGGRRLHGLLPRHPVHRVQDVAGPRAGQVLAGQRPRGGHPLPGPVLGRVRHRRPGQHRRRGRRGHHRWRRCDVLDDRGRPARHVHQVRRVHARREVPRGPRGRLGDRRRLPLPAGRLRALRHRGVPGTDPRLRGGAVPLRCRRRQHVPGQPDLRPGAGGHRRRRRLPRRRPGRRSSSGSSSPLGVGLVILGGITLDRQGHLPPGAGDGGALPLRLLPW